MHTHGVRFLQFKDVSGAVASLSNYCIFMRTGRRKSRTMFGVRVVLVGLLSGVLGEQLSEIFIGSSINSLTARLNTSLTELLLFWVKCSLVILCHNLLTT